MWFVYILKCADKTLYSGVTVNVERRVTEHNSSPKGAKYTRARRPVKLVYWEPCMNRSNACKREAELKKLKRLDKLALIEQFQNNLKT